MSERFLLGVPLTIVVDCYAGYRGDETPRRFQFAGTEVIVADVVDRWLSPDHRYFKVVGEDGDTYILRHDIGSGRWELTMFQRKAASAGRAEGQP